MHTICRLVCIWFLKIDPMWIVGMRVCARARARVCVCVCVCVCGCVCPRLSLLITIGMMWHDMDLISLVKQVLQLLNGNYSHYH